MKTEIVDEIRQIRDKCGDSLEFLRMVCDAVEDEMPSTSEEIREILDWHPSSFKVAHELSN